VCCIDRLNLPPKVVLHCVLSECSTAEGSDSQVDDTTPQAPEVPGQHFFWRRRWLRRDARGHYMAASA
jgi:hypothetical protein